MPGLVPSVCHAPLATLCPCPAWERAGRASIPPCDLGKRDSSCQPGSPSAAGLGKAVSFIPCSGVQHPHLVPNPPTPSSSPYEPRQGQPRTPTPLVAPLRSRSLPAYPERVSNPFPARPGGQLMFLQVATSVRDQRGVGNAGWARADCRLGANPSLPPQGPSKERTPPSLRNKNSRGTAEIP